MEIDRLKGEGGKGKYGKGGKGKYDKGGKGKRDKGKGKSYWQSSKGKDKGKKGDQQHQSGKGKGNKNGHWKRDCRAYKDDQERGTVRQVEETGSIASTAGPSASQVFQPQTAPSAQSSTYKSAASVRRLAAHSNCSFHDVGDDSNMVDLTIFDMAPESDIEDCFDLGGNVFMIRMAEPEEQIACPVFDMTATDHDEHWHVCGNQFDNPVGLEYFHVRAISEDFHSTDMVDIILDSGSDTALPKNFQGVGNDVQPSHHCVYYDAQGGQLQAQQHKRAQVQVGNMKLVDDFIVTDVSNPILPLGKLLRAGFTLAHGDDEQMYLSCGHMRAPVHFRRNSLCIRGFIRHIPSRDASAASEEVARDEYVRTVVISEPLQYLGNSWVEISAGLWALKVENPRFFVEPDGCPVMDVPRRRTTVVIADNQWHLVEYCELMENRDVLREPLAHEGLTEFQQSITFLHNDWLAPEDMGFEYQPVAVEDQPQVVQAGSGSELNLANQAKGASIEPLSLVLAQMQCQQIQSSLSQPLRIESQAFREMCWRYSPICLRVKSRLRV